MVIGYLRLDFEGTTLYTNEVDYRAFIFTNAIWLNFGAAPIDENWRRLDSRYVLVEGRFK